MFEKLEAENTLWVEKYRPKTLDGYIGNEDIISKVKIYIESGDVGHLLFHGNPGTGKTSISKIIANSIDCDVMYINASDENSVDTVREKIKSFASTIGFAPIKLILCDEFDQMTFQGQAALRNLMEVHSKTTRFILTCNYVEKIIDAIQSRCQVFQVIPPNKSEVAKRLVYILNEEGISYEMKDVATVVNSGYPDIRRVINSVQRQIIDNKLVVDKQSMVEANYTLKVVELLKSEFSTKDKLTNIRQLIEDSKVKTFEPLYLTLFDEVDDWGKGHVGAMILIIAEAQATDNLVVNKNLNVIAMIVRILSELN